MKLHNASWCYVILFNVINFLNLYPASHSSSKSSESTKKTKINIDNFRLFYHMLYCTVYHAKALERKTL